MDFQLTRSRRRTIMVQIEPDGTLTVRAPMLMPRPFIEAFVQQKEAWIKRQLERQGTTVTRQFEYHDGAMLPYLGQDYPIQMVDGARLSVRFDRAFIIPKLTEAHTKILLTDWFKQQAKVYLTKRMDFYAGRMGVTYSRFRVSSARTRWGSCSKDGSIYLSWRLIHTPPEMVDYVVVHELAHLKYHNHSKVFWQFVESILPQYREARRWYRDHGYLLYT